MGHHWYDDEPRCGTAPSSHPPLYLAGCEEAALGAERFAAVVEESSVLAAVVVAEACIGLGEPRCLNALLSNLMAGLVHHPLTAAVSLASDRAAVALPTSMAVSPAFGSNLLALVGVLFPAGGIAAGSSAAGVSIWFAELGGS